MNNEIQPKVISQYNILETKKKMKALEDYLAKQYVEYEEQLEIKKKQKQRHENAKKQRGNRFSSFANSLHRPQYITALKESELFENKSTFVNSNVPFIPNIAKSQLIEPDRNKNSQPILHQLHRPFNKMESEFPPIRKRFLSQKEIKRIDFWDSNYNKLKEVETQQNSQMLIGKIKKQLLEQKERLLFKPTDQCLRYFDKHPPLISNFPISTRKSDQALPKINKVWMPNNNYF